MPSAVKLDLLYTGICITRVELLKSSLSWTRQIAMSAVLSMNSENLQGRIYRLSPCIAWSVVLVECVLSSVRVASIGKDRNSWHGMAKLGTPLMLQSKT